jgi:DNA-directed RNA polymerase subunit RPC12/RpoP
MKWIDLGNGEYRCSKCKKEFIFGLDLSTFIKAFPFCPICGADMKGGEHE